MFQLGKTIVSEDILSNDFVCNLSACKGACCVDGDGALSLEETKTLEEIYPQTFFTQEKLQLSGTRNLDHRDRW
jgi:hypothetical protein